MKRRAPGAIPAGQIISIVVTIGLLVAVIVMKSRCPVAVESLFKAVESRPAADAGQAHSPHSP